MKKFTQHNFFKQIANLIITGTVFIILFGHGVHIHTVFDHLLDHGIIYVTLHVHPSDDHQSESDSANMETEDHHQHPIASIDLNATLEQSTNKKAIPATNTCALYVHEQLYSALNNSPPTLLAQPPPDLILSQDHLFYFSQRAPPTA